jgi:hypothetical protein
MPTQVAVALGAIMREKQAQQLPCGVFGSFGCVPDCLAREPVSLGLECMWKCLRCCDSGMCAGCQMRA